MPEPSQVTSGGMPVMGRPSEMRYVAPRATNIMPSVMMKGWGMCSLVRPSPLTVPTKRPARSGAIMTTGQAAPLSARMAAHIIASARTEPIERSMPAVTMTMNSPSASSW